jgi:CheY-like chemotaxis protein
MTFQGTRLGTRVAVFNTTLWIRGLPLGSSDFHLLIAHENPSLRELYQKHLQDEGYQVEVVEKSSEILAPLEKGGFHLLVTDLQMLPKNTLEIIPLIRERWPKLPIVVVAGYYLNVFGDILEQGKDVHVFFTQPLTVPNLKKAVRRMLGLPPNGNE